MSTRKVRFCSSLFSYISVKNGTLLGGENLIKLNCHDLLYSYESVTIELYRTSKGSFISRQSPGLYWIYAYPRQVSWFKTNDGRELHDYSYYGLNCPPSTPTLANSYVEALASDLILFGDGAFGRELEWDEVMRVGPWFDGISAFIRKELASYPLPHAYTRKVYVSILVRKWPSTNQEESHFQNPTVLDPDLRLPAFRIVRK